MVVASSYICRFGAHIRCLENSITKRMRFRIRCVDVDVDIDVEVVI
jgi:hypothetical protein